MTSQCALFGALWHALHGALHVAYFVGVAVSNFGKFYGAAAGVLAAIGVVALFKGGEP